MLVLLTKADKLNRSDAQKALVKAQEALSDVSADSADVGVALFSALSRLGLGDAAEHIHGWAHRAPTVIEDEGDAPAAADPLTDPTTDPVVRPGADPAVDQPES